MPKMILRVVRPGALDADDDDHWEGESDLVALEEDEDGGMIERGRKSFDTMAEASKYLAGLLKGE